MPDVKEPSGAWRALLLGDAQIAAMVGTRIYPVIMPQGVTGTSIVYQDISAVGDHHMQGASGLARVRLQLAAWAQKATDAKALGALIKGRIDGYKGTVLWGSGSPQNSLVVQGIFFDSARDLYDPEVKMHYRVSDFIAFYEER